MTATEQAPERTQPRKRSRRRWTRRLGWVAGVGALLLAAPVVWVQVASAGHRHDTPSDAPDAPVVIVFGAELAPGGTRPKPFLAGRLDVARTTGERAS